MKILGRAVRPELTSRRAPFHAGRVLPVCITSRQTSLRGYPVAPITHGADTYTVLSFVKRKGKLEWDGSKHYATYLWLQAPP